CFADAETMGVARVPERAPIPLEQRPGDHGAPEEIGAVHRVRWIWIRAPHVHVAAKTADEVGTLRFSESSQLLLPFNLRQTVVENAPAESGKAAAQSAREDKNRFSDRVHSVFVPECPILHWRQ